MVSVGPEHVELALAYLRREIGMAQCAAALIPNKPYTSTNTQARSLILRSLILAHDQGLLVIKAPKKR
jgi:hypothetical protein